MHALIDADRLAYAFGGLKDEEGNPQPWGIVQARVDDNIQATLNAVDATSYCLYLTSDDKSNFRFDVATIKPYKGNRKSEKYFWYQTIRQYLIYTWEAIVVTGMEADDALGIDQYKDWEWHETKMAYFGETPGKTIICSVDKDLDNIPGWHYNELKKEKYWVSQEDSLHNFYCQLLVGDAVDNILGIFGIGKSSVLCKHICAKHSELDMYIGVKEEYIKRFGNYWKLFMYENAQLLWILRSNDTSEIIKRFTEFEGQGATASLED